MVCKEGVLGAENETKVDTIFFLDALNLVKKLFLQASFLWSRWGSNPRPRECHSRALPSELRPHKNRSSIHNKDFENKESISKKSSAV